MSFSDEQEAAERVDAMQEKAARDERRRPFAVGIGCEAQVSAHCTGGALERIDGVIHCLMCASWRKTQDEHAEDAAKCAAGHHLWWPVPSRQVGVCDRCGEEREAVRQ